MKELLSNKRQRFSIRKVAKMGAVSALIGTAIFMGGTVVQADETTPSTVLTDTETPKVTETTIVSPTTYKADETKEVGYEAVETKGTDGKLTIDQSSDKPVVTRQEQTETVVDLGTKPTVTETIAKATTTYEEDSTLGHGETKVVTEAKDGVDKTTTTYKIVTSPDYKFDSKNEALLNSDRNQYNPEKFWHIDDTKELPSDKVVIDKLFTDYTLSEDDKVDDISVREIIQPYLIQEDRIVTGASFGNDLTLSTVSDNNLKYVISGADSIIRMADGVYLGKINYDSVTDKDGNFIVAKPDVRAEYLHSLMTEQGAIERYFASFVISDSLYADMKANYQRFLKFNEAIQSSDADTSLKEEFKTYADRVDKAFEGITNRYNNINSDASALSIVNDSRYFSSDDFDWFKEQVAKLPYEIRKNVIKVTVKEGQILEPIEGYNTLAIGATYIAGKYIDLRYDSEGMGSKEEVLRVFLHELSHAIAYGAGYDYARVNESGPKQDMSIFMTPEFKTIFDTYFAEGNPNGTVRKYNRENMGEAFAEAFGQYLRHRLFGLPYDVYVTLTDSEMVKWSDNKDKSDSTEKSDNIVLLTSYKPGRSHYSAEEYQKLHDKYYAKGYNPFKLAEPYFASLYNKLFEQPTKAKVVVDKVTNEVTDKQDGKVLVGTKPTEEVVVTPYATCYVADDSAEAGQVTTIQTGQNGETKKVTTYHLVSANSPEVTSTLNEELVLKAVDEVKAVGTKATTEIITVPYNSTEQADDTLEFGVRKVIQAGQNGHREKVTTYELVDATTGELKATVSENVLDDVINEIIAVGTKKKAVVTTTEDVTRTEPVAYTSVERTNAKLPKGQRRVVQVGRDGVRTIIERVTKVDSQETAREEISNTVTTEPIAEIVEIGTKDMAKTDKVQSLGRVQEKTTHLQTQAVTNQVLARRGTVANYQASLPETGEQSTAVYSLVGLVTVGFGVAMAPRKRSKNI